MTDEENFEQIVDVAEPTRYYQWYGLQKIVPREHKASQTTHEKMSSLRALTCGILCSLRTSAPRGRFFFAMRPYYASQRNVWCMTSGAEQRWAILRTFQSAGEYPKS